jgi:hypothetical protein
MSRTTVFVILVAVLMVAAPPASPGLPCKHCPCCDHAVCLPVPETTTETKHGWQVECKELCIPAIQWPWLHACALPRCGRVKTVKVLKKVEYECERCGYKWEIRSTVPPCEKPPSPDQQAAAIRSPTPR